MNTIILLLFIAFSKTSLNTTQNIDVEATNDKLKTIRKVAPYFPEESIPIVNKAVLLTTKILTIQETINFLQTDEPFTTIKHKEVKDNKERLNHIISTLKKEIPDEKTKSTIATLEMFINIDKYKDVFSALNKIIANPEESSDIDKLIHIMEPFMENMDEKQKEQLLNIAKVLQK